jgi:hypothetical protein
MKSLLGLLLVGTLVAAPGILEAKITRTREMSFPIEPGGTLRASTEGGNIQVVSGEVSEVQISVRHIIRANSDAEADSLLANLELVLERRGNDVIAESRYSKKPGLFGHRPVQVDFTITVPRQFNAELKTSGGNIKVGDLRGTVNARTSGGNLIFDRIDGALEGRTSGGNISLRESTGETSLQTSGGNIRVESASGRIQVSTSGGDVRLDDVSDLVSATTSGGNIRVNFTGALRQDARISTSGGSVTVRVPKQASFALDARTSGGHVKASGVTLTIADGGLGKSRLAGDVNGGGPQLKLRTSGGNITVQTE